jgi:tetratricopeptide (TPR) repeat protein
MRQPIVILLLLASLVAPHSAASQFPPERTKNLKVLPADIPMRALIDTMAGFTRALGVRCTFCHMGKETEPLSSYDFASDEKTGKLKAREMLRMVMAINGEHLTKLVSRRSPPIVVTCATCHRGVTEPRSLQQRMLLAFDSAGADSAEALYRALRQRYYGSASYDFGEVPLADVASALRDRQRMAEALRFHALNTEFNPTSGFAWRQLAQLQLAKGDTAATKASLEKALSINPNDRQAKETLEKLGKSPL